MSYHLSGHSAAPPNPADPYSTPNKRRRADDGAVAGQGTVDPNAARRLDTGFQGAPVTIDGPGTAASMAEPGGVLPPAPLAGSSVHYGDGIFMLLGDRNARPLGRKLFNGLDVSAARDYPGDAAMQLLAIKQSIVVLGAASEAVKVTQDNMTPSLTVKYAGLHTPNVVSMKAGARMMWNLRQFTADVAANTARSTDAAAEYYNAYGLVLEAYDERTVGTQFNKAASELVNNSATWARAQANVYGKTRPMLAAVLAHFRNVETGAILFLEKLLRYGVVQLVPALAGGAAVPATLALNAVNLINPADPLLLQHAGLVGPLAAPRLDSHDIAARIANFVGLTSPTNPATEFLTPQEHAFWATLQREFADSLYYTANANSGGSLQGSVNAAAEFGASYSPIVGPQFAGRFLDNRLKEDRIGAVVKLQCNSGPQAVSAFAQAAEATQLWMAGTAMSNAPNGRGLMMMHK